MQVAEMKGLVLVDSNDLANLFKEITESNIEDEVLTLEQAAMVLKKNKNTLSTEIRNGSTVPHRREGKEYRFSKKAIFKWLDNQ